MKRLTQAIALVAIAAGLCLLILGAPEWASWAAIGVVVWAVLRGAT